MGVVTVDHIKAFYEDERYLFARIVKQIHLSSGLDKAPIAGAIVVVYLGLVVLSPEAFGNGLLVLYPVTLKLLFPLEIPVNSEMNAYWASYGLSTLLDQTLPAGRNVAFYFIMKLAVFLLFFLQPFCLAEKIANRLPRAVDYVISTANDTVKAFDDNINQSFKKTGSVSKSVTKSVKVQKK
uniref:Receptor expression-enhancing protein n=1 Tax=Panagrellus redivivus TaxID=6233 RepID=A0A7E4ZX81_PANRE